MACGLRTLPKMLDKLCSIPFRSAASLYYEYFFHGVSLIIRSVKQDSAFFASKYSKKEQILQSIIRFRCPVEKGIPK